MSIERPGPSQPRQAPLAGRIFPELAPGLCAALEAYEDVLEKGLALKPKHLRELHYAVRDLSRALTGDKSSSLPLNYLSRPVNLSAYAYYFLPWNLYRLGRLFSGLSFDLPDDARIIDLGAGPLTLAQALWLARPDLRNKKLNFLCLDRAQAPLKLGRELFRIMAPDSSWRFEFSSEPLHKLRGERADLLTAANVLVEMAGGRPSERREMLERLVENIFGLLSPGGKMLIVEPGVRAEGKLISKLREIILEEGGGVAGPCPHEGPCPMLAGPGRGWCHFNFTVNQAPGWLHKLSQIARLAKRSASLSFLLAGAEPLAPLGGVRVISDAFNLPGRVGADFGRYGCGERGLVLLTSLGRTMVRPGDLVNPVYPETPLRDEKSGAIEAAL